MENYASIVPLVVFIPLAGMLINLIWGARLGEKGVGAVASVASGSAFVVALLLMVMLARSGYEAVVVNPPILTGWITIPSAALEIPWQFRVDTLSVTMMLVVTGVGTLIHIYAVGYMHGDARFPRFFVYLNLFLVFMLILVTGNNLLMTFVGWEGVGLCSFLLIGFWFDKARGEGWRNSNAARKAFIVNRVGDFGFLLAIFLTFWTFGTLDYYKPGEPVQAGEEKAAVVQEATAAQTPTTGEAAANTANKPTGNTQMKGTVQLGIFGQTEQWMKEGGHKVRFGSTDVPFETIITLITLFILIGVTGKSAQIPLFVWLPDAMAGPTPVSALIHAATMVTAGIYLATRCNVFFHAAPLSSGLMTIVGACTAVFAGFVAMGQWDIKKVLAYSTVSQLGFMVAAVGLGAFSAAYFHLITHAFFKALLFLGSGSVIHGMEHGHHHVEHLGHDEAHGDVGAHGALGSHGEAHADEHGTQTGPVAHIPAIHTVDVHDDVGARGAIDAQGTSAADAHEAHAAHGATNTPIPEEVMHSTPFDAQDMRNMGGLRRKMPITFWTYLIGTLALSGIFPLAGFWSKDDILASAFRAGFNEGRIDGYIALALLLVAAFFTAFYMWRQIRYVFLGKPRSAAAENAPESVPLMTIPLILLAILSVFGGLLNLVEPFVIQRFGMVEESLTRWLEHSVQYATGGAFNFPLAITALAVAVIAIVVADRLYGRANPLTKKGRDPLEMRPETRGAFGIANAKGYTDAIYSAIIEQPYNRASQWLANVLDWKFWHDYVHDKLIWKGFDGVAALLSGPVDRSVIDRGFLGIGGLISRIAARLRGLQTGYVRTYTFTMLVGVLIVLFLILFPLIRLAAGGQ